MGTRFTFNAATRIVEVLTAPVDGLSSEDAIGMYSEAKVDWRDIPALGPLDFAFSQAGGNPIGGGRFVGSYVFLRNDLGWRIRPYDASHELTVVGNLYPFDITLPVFVPTASAVQVPIFLERSSLAQATSGGGLDTTQDARLRDLWRRRGLDPANPASVSPTGLTAGDVVQTYTEELDGSITVQRT